MLLLVSTAFGWQVTHRDALSLDVSRDRSRLFRENWDGKVENVYTLHVQNRTAEAATYALGVDGEVPFTWEGPQVVEVPARTRESFSIRLVMDPTTPTSAEQVPVFFHIRAEGAEQVGARKKSRFIRPEEVYVEESAP